ncbi:DUF308 domain-containing protein [Metabacillus indicus]|uniref:DUF308 domain-containing protein n=1 Tax=Metabacillus indicus TaxID=246786 RepID=A0A084GWL2_METID|nr:DUF308 domain-containing protein [Metabacillus indicus]KEZ51035.1 hypothetical protein AZ46_0210515 [Metabacillus indicus LMG 22858]KEZ51724.1 hypothetical protein GS18_0211425 [Metabacillus indicus]
MADEKHYDYHGNIKEYDLRDDEVGYSRDFRDDYREETAAELAAPATLRREADYDRRDEEEGVRTDGRRMGYLAIVLSVISLFVFPVILGAAGIIVGFVARRRGAEALGGWAIGIGIVSLILGIFILPFF